MVGAVCGVFPTLPTENTQVSGGFQALASDLRMPVVDSLAPAWAFRLLIAHAEAGSGSVSFGRPL